MDYSKQVFGKSLANLSYQDIVDYFVEQKEETDTLEFKSFPAAGNLNDKYKGLFKAICAFGNSSGGIIIWGAPEGISVTGKKEKIFSGALTHIDATIEKDQLVSKISTSIIPLANYFSCNILEDGGNKVCVIEIQESNYSPHQTDGKYYMRLDGQSVPAPHHFIEAKFRKISYPNLEGYFKIDSIELYQGGYLISFSVLIFNDSPLQNEEKLSWQINFNIGQFERWPHVDYQNQRTLIKRNAIDVLSYGEPYLYRDSIIITTRMLAQANYTIVISMQFNGKTSPTKRSDYSFNMNGVGTGVGNYTDRYLSIKENILVKDFVDANGITKEEQLRHVLGR